MAYNPQAASRYVLRLPGVKDYPIPLYGLRIGRTADNAIPLTDNLVSRHHATVWEQGGRCFVRDEGSTNGTLINGQRLTGGREVRHGDTLTVGHYTFHIVAAGAGAGAVAGDGLLTIDSATARAAGSAPGSGAAIAAVFAIFGLIAILVLFAVLNPPPPPGATPTITLTLTPPSGATPTITLTLTPPPGATPTITLTLTPTLKPVQRVLAAAVRIEVPKGTTGTISGSGSALSASGYILTNLHVVVDPDTNRPYNSQGTIRIGTIVQNVDKPPQNRYLAEVVAKDADLDLALLRVRATISGGALPSDLGLVTVPIGDSDKLVRGDTLIIIGFPGLAATVTLTRGTMSGFEPDSKRDKAWIKTDASLAPGNSGGLAINEAGELVGIPSIVVHSRDDETAKLGGIRPINLARTLLSQVR